MYRTQSIYSQLGYQRIYDETTKHASEASVFSLQSSKREMALEERGQLLSFASSVFSIKQLS